MNITGNNFREGSFAFGKLSVSPNVTYGPNGYEYQAKSCRVLQSTLGENTTIQCLTRPGIGKDHSWVISFGDVKSGDDSCGNYGVCSSYFAPVISNISSGSPLNSLSTSGGDFVTITGDFFGDVENALNASYSVNTENVDESVLATSVFHAIDCTLQIPHEKIICSTVAGVGGGLQWSVGVSNQISTQSDKIISYKSPVITAISSSAFPKLRGFNTSGGDSITLSGSNFGPQYPTDRKSVV